MRPRQGQRQRAPDYFLLGLALLLLFFGWAMLYSASAIFAEARGGDSFLYLKRQVLFSVPGLGLMFFFSRLRYNRLREVIWPIFGLTLLALIGVLFAPPIKGASRWIPMGPFNFQPAEAAKLTLVIFLADYLDRKRSKVANIVQGMVVPCTVIGIPLLLIGLEPDLGTPSLLFAVMMLVLFVGGIRPRHLGLVLVSAVPVLAIELLRVPYRRARLFSFLNPFEDATGIGYQLSQALLAIGSGGWFGKGLGGSQIKLMYLPDPHTDFIFPVLCEELGLAGAAVLIGLFAVLLLRGVKIAKGAPDLFGMLLATGLTFLISLQAFFNVAMSIGLLPTKGLPLPFFSYGGSSLLVTLAAVGILLNISRHCETSPGRAAARYG